MQTETIYGPLAYKTLLWHIRYILMAIFTIQYKAVDPVRVQDDGRLEITVRKYWLYWFISKPIVLKMDYYDEMGHRTPFSFRAFLSEYVSIREIVFTHNDSTVRGLTVENALDIYYRLILFYILHYSMMHVNDKLPDVICKTVSRFMANIKRHITNNMQYSNYFAAIQQITTMLDQQDKVVNKISEYNNRECFTEVPSYVERFKIDVVHGSAPLIYERMYGDGYYAFEIDSPHISRRDIFGHEIYQLPPINRLDYIHVLRMLRQYTGLYNKESVVYSDNNYTLYVTVERKCK